MANKEFQTNKQTNFNHPNTLPLYHSIAISIHPQMKLNPISIKYYLYEILWNNIYIPISNGPKTYKT